MFIHHFIKQNNFCDLLLVPLTMKPFQKGSSLYEKNLLLQEQILSFKSRPPLRKDTKMKTTELFPLKVYSFILRAEYLHGCRLDKIYPDIGLSQFMMATTAISDNFYSIETHIYVVTENIILLHRKKKNKFEGMPCNITSSMPWRI